ncbi:MAG: LamG domain-containing protein [Planctomycetia bacterium]|nr:LamG domain-containing protein [Planctomycetia bacterium]
MAKNDRRQFFKQSAAGLAAASGLTAGSPAAAADAAPQVSPAPVAQQQSYSQKTLTADDQIPPHRVLPLPGIHAYAEKSIAAGETIHFRVSSDVPYRMEVCRLAGDVDDSKADVVLSTVKSSEPAQQPIHPGSYIYVERGLPHDAPLNGLTLECWVRPWKLNATQGIVTQQDAPNAAGVGLMLSDQGCPRFCLDSGAPIDAPAGGSFVILSGPSLKLRRWSHLAATFDGREATLWVNGRKVASAEVKHEVRPAAVPLRLGACSNRGVADYFLEGDIAMPAVHGRALTADEIRQHIDNRGLTPPDTKDLLACWPLTEERGDTLADVSSHERHGRIINHATWMIGGPSFKGDEVGRFDAAYDPAKDPQRGHGLRFASDDLFDCRWNVSHKFDVPADAKSGVYAARFHYEAKGKPLTYHTTFVVRRAASRPKTPILVLTSTSTWLAYGATPFALYAPRHANWPTGGLSNSPAGAPAYCCYRDHAAGQPTYYLGLKMPWPSAGPDVLYSQPQVGYSHLMRGELFAHRWLDGHYGDHAGYDYDVATDIDIDRDPHLLDGYKTLVINGHSEYWSTPAMQALKKFYERGGTAVVLSGNTMFWRTAFNQDHSVMECRKFDARIGGRGGATIGELYYSQDQKRGSLMRECGMPAWEYIGLDCIGWIGTARDDFRPYEVTEPKHFLFEKPENVGLAKDETFGHGPRGALPRAVGHEWDVRLSTLKRATRAVPEGAAPLPDDPPGITTLAVGRQAKGGALDYFTAPISEKNGVCVEVIYWERPDSGKVFNAGSIAAGWVLSNDPKMRTLLRNVLAHFGVLARPVKT